MTPAQSVMAEQCTGRGRNGVVCAAAPLAALAGSQILRAGGNAFDAAVAAALAETVLLPPKCGFGGDLIAIVVDRRGVPSTTAITPRSVIAVGGAAPGLAAVADAGAWSDVGPTSVGAPGAAAGYAALAACGVLPRHALAAPAIDLARNGFPWAAVCTRLSEQAARLVADMNPAGTSYYPDGPIAPETLVRLPGLADVLDEWVQRGADLLAGPVGAAIVTTVRDRGGVLDQQSLSSVRVTWDECVQQSVRGQSVWATPAPTHGPSLLDAVANAASSDPADSYRAVMAAITRRRDTLSDPSGTSMVSAADADGNVVIIVHSNSFPRFGSGLIVPGYDLVLNNRAGRGFSPQPGHPNFPVAGRRPAITLHAWAVGDIEGRVRLLGATPGGANQMPWNAQAIMRVLAGCDRPGELVTAPLWEWLPDDDGVRIETGFDPALETSLRAVVPRAVMTSAWGCKSAQQVVRIPNEGEPWSAAADPRTQGAAIGV